MKTYTGRKRSKTNPSKVCFCCNERIFNRQKNSKYCLDCYRLVEIVRKRMYVLLRKFEIDYNGYDIHWTFMIKKKSVNQYESN